MGLTRDFKETIKERAARDPEFVQAMLNEAISSFLSGEPQTARLILRDVVNATCGFEQLAAATDTPAKSLHRMLSQTGNPSMDNLATILAVLQKQLKFVSQVQVVTAKPSRTIAAKTAGRGRSTRAR